MEQIYKVEFLLSDDRRGPVVSNRSKEKEYRYLEGCKALLDMGVTQFTASFHIFDPDTRVCKNDSDYMDRQRLRENRQIRMEWRFRYIQLNRKIIDNKKVRELVVINITHGEVIVVDRISYTDSPDYFYKISDLKLLYGNLEVIENDGTLGEIQYNAIKS